MLRFGWTQVYKQIELINSTVWRATVAETVRLQSKLQPSCLTREGPKMLLKLGAAEAGGAPAAPMRLSGAVETAHSGGFVLPDF